VVRFSHGLVSGRTGWSWGAWVGVWGDGLVGGRHRCFATAWSVTSGRGRGRNPRPCRSPTLLAVADPVPAAAAVAGPAAGSPQRAWRSRSSLKRVLRKTGLLSRSAAPPLQLDSLRRPGSRRPIDRQRSPPVVSTAFLVPVTRFSVTRYPRIPCGLAAPESRQAAREALSQPPALSGPRACDPHGKGLSPRPLA
jgi:hypothetical protein